MPIALPLDIRMDIAPDADPDGDPSLWLWRDVSGYRRASADVSTSTGRPDEASEIEAGEASTVIDLRDGLLSPRNPLSELYQRIGVNTPIRFRLLVGHDDFDRTSVGSWSASPSGQIWATGPSYNGINGGSGKIGLVAPNITSTGILSDVGAIDIDVVYSAAIDAVTTGGPWIAAVMLRRVDNDNCYRVHTELKPAGVITTKIVRAASAVLTDLDEDLTVTGTYAAGDKVWTRAQAVAGWIRSKVWTGTVDDEPDEWNLSVADAEIEGAGFALYQWRLGSNTNVGTLTVGIDDLQIHAILWEGNVPEWSPRWDKSGNDATTDLVAAGPLRRLSAGTRPLKSPLTNQLALYGPAGWWPAEDEASAQALASGIQGGGAATISNITLAADADALAGSKYMAKIDTDAARVVGRCKNVTYTEWSGMVFYKFPSLPGSEVRLIEWETAGTIHWWQLYASPATFRLRGYDVNNTLLLDALSSVYIIDPTNTFSIQLETTQDGANIDWAMIWNQVGEDVFWATTGTVAGDLGRPLGFKINGTTFQDALFGQIWFGPESLPYVNPTFLAVSSGFAGEEDRDRAERLALEAGVPLVAYPGQGEALGRQLPGKFLDLERNAAKGGLATLFERGGTLGFIPRSARYNAPVTLALDWAAGQLAEAPRPTDDDQRLRNQWTISRTGGSEYTDQRDYGPNSVARRGLMPDGDEVNIQLDERLRQYVGWYLNVSTFDGFRWPSIEIDLIANPGLIPSFLACRVGSRVTIDNPKSQIPGITIDLLIEGIKQDIGLHRWDVELSCSPALPWDVAVYDDLTKRKDSRNSTFDASYDADDATIVVTFPVLSDQWSQTNEPYLWDVAGETIRVDSMGAVTGTGPFTQSASVTRNITGDVAKSHAAGESVHMHPTQLARYAL